MKWRASVVFLGLLLPGAAAALEIQNVRPAYGVLGATRLDNKFLPGDVLMIHFDIEGLKVNDKTGTVRYYSELEFFDSKKKRISQQKNEIQELQPDLGGTRIPSDLNAIMGKDQPPGKYTLKWTIHDVYGKTSASREYAFELLPVGYGVIQALSPAFGVPGSQH